MKAGGSPGSKGGTGSGSVSKSQSRSRMPGRGTDSPLRPDRRAQLQASTRISALTQILGTPVESVNTVLQESDQPYKKLLHNEDIADAVVSSISDSLSGKVSDRLCQWLYDAYEAGDPDLQAVVLRFVPALCGVYFSRTCGDTDEPLAGFEALLLALYTGEARARGGRAVMMHLPNLSRPSLYHTPVQTSSSLEQGVDHFTDQLSAPLEPQTAVKSTKRAAIVGLALELFWKQIAIMPAKAKLELCQHATRWAISGCAWAPGVDQISKLALPATASVMPPPDTQCAPELGHALTTGEPLAVSQAVLEQPPHYQTLESSKAAIVERTLSDAFASSIGSLSFNSATSSVEHLIADGAEEASVKLSLSLDILRPTFKVLGHCLMARTSSVPLKEAALSAAKAHFVRASQDLVPEAILASRSLVRLGAASIGNTQTNESRSFSASPGSAGRDLPDTVESSQA